MYKRLSPDDRGRVARTIRREIAEVERQRRTRLDLMDALADYHDLLLTEFFHDCHLLHRLRSAANRLEFVPPADQETSEASETWPPILLEVAA